MKTCVFITGTNGVGKTELAHELIRRFGGISSEDGDLTILGDGKVTMAGRYAGLKHGGVDGLNRTSCLPALAEKALARHECIICEGFYLHTHGPNLIKTIFQGEARLLVLLYCDIRTIHERLLKRSGKGITKFVIATQEMSIRAAEKFSQEGVTVMPFDTSKVTPPILLI